VLDVPGGLLGGLVVCGMIPYTALQLKAVSASFKMIARVGAVLDVFDPTLLVAIALALFGILFGARNLDFTKQQTGLMTDVAVESVVKLLAFLLVGVYVTWGLFGGFGDLFGRIAAHPDWSRLLVLDRPETASYARWTAMLVISMAAVMFLPRQFHVLVVQNPRERDVNSVSWSFPLYLFLINLFYYRGLGKPIAFCIAKGFGLNLREMARTAEAYKRYLKKFDDQETEIERLQKLIKELQEGEHVQRKEYENFLANLTVE